LTLKTTNKMKSWLATRKTALSSALSAAALAAVLTAFMGKDSTWAALKTGEKNEGFVCEPHQYTTEIISVDPLVVYINNFVSPRESQLLIALGCVSTPSLMIFALQVSSIFSLSKNKANTIKSSPSLAASEVYLGGTKQSSNERTSKSAGLPPTHPLTTCILSRARSFMGSLLSPSEDFGTPQIVQYQPGQKFDTHHDWYPSPQRVRSGEMAGKWFNRVASFFVYLEGIESGVKGGGTWFPHVKGKEDKYGRWEKGQDGGMTFLPKEGNAVFWVNLHSNGTGDGRVVHAGLGVEDGRKTAMNIWPRKFF
jgi:prolyl 4-hydroxylase